MIDAELNSVVLNILDRVRESQPVEGTRIELKTDWPEPKAAARTIAAMCNAAGGDAVLLRVGVDEKGARVPGASPEEVANWWPQVQREFDRDFPSMLAVSPVHTQDATVVALLFDSRRAPYVVRNPPYGQPGGRHVPFEIPWREGNATKSARREHLIRMVVPQVGVPTLELMDGWVSYQPGSAPTWNFSVQLEVFASMTRPCTLIGHRTALVFDPVHLGPIPGSRPDRKFKDDHFSPMSAQRAITLLQPSSFWFYAEGTAACSGPILPNELCLKIDFAVDGIERTASLDLPLILRPQPGGAIFYVPRIEPQVPTSTDGHPAGKG